jgi:hypothetical protein
MSPMINYTAEFSSTRIVQSAPFSLPRSQKNIPWEMGIIGRARDLTRSCLRFVQIREQLMNWDAN